MLLSGRGGPAAPQPRPSSRHRMSWWASTFGWVDPLPGRSTGTSPCACLHGRSVRGGRGRLRSGSGPFCLCASHGSSPRRARVFDSIEGLVAKARDEVALQQRAGGGQRRRLATECLEVIDQGRCPPPRSSSRVADGLTTMEAGTPTPRCSSRSACARVRPSRPPLDRTTPILFFTWRSPIHHLPYQLCRP